MNADRIAVGFAPGLPRIGRRPGRLRRATDWLVELLPVALALFLSLAWLASLAIPVRKHLLAGDFSWLPSAAVYLLLAGGVAWWLWKARNIPEHRLVGALIGAAVLVRLVLAGSTLQLPLNTDQALFRHFVREMADSALNGDALSGLSAFYDYPVWAGRAMPVHYAVRRWAGPQDLPWIRLLNVGISAAILLATYGLACRLLPPGRRKWAIFLMVALPFQSFVVSDYSHHLLSSFYFLVGIWVAWELLLSRSGLWRRAGLALVAGGCLLLMAWQRGIHLIALGVWSLLVLWTLIRGRGWRKTGGLVLGLLLVPLVLAWPAARIFDRCLARHDEHRLNSILPAFMARGWCPESGGEYCRRYEQLDLATPWPEKSQAMYRLVLSQIRRNPVDACLRLPLIKTAKLFLVGYASNFEESLVAEAAPVLPWVRGMRLAAAPLFLGAACWGSFLLCLCPAAQRRWLPILLAPLVTWGTYVFLGESSPRYSIFCQPFLALLGAWGLGDISGLARKLQGGGISGMKAVSVRLAVVLGVAVLAMGGVVLGVRLLPTEWIYADLQSGWKLSSSAATAPAIRPGALEPFEVQWCLATGARTESVDWQLPRRPDSMNRLSWYLLEVDPGLRAARLAIGLPDVPPVVIPLQDASLPRRVEIELPPGAATLRFALELPQDGGPASGRIALGYFSFSAGDVPD